MTDRTIEKKFLYLLLFSLCLHGIIFSLLVLFPADQKPFTNEPLMVDLQNLPEVKTPSPPQPPQKAQRHGEQRQRVVKEMAPRGAAEQDRLPSQQRPVQPFPVPPPRSNGRESAPVRQPERGEVPSREESPREELFRRRDRGKVAQPQLFPSANKMAQLEEVYRKKYGPEVAEGATRFLNTDDILFGSFLRRFETAVYGVWRYPSDAAKLGIEGITPVKITFNRQGEIIGHEILQSSGSKILDEEVVRALDQIGPIGAFPRGFDKDTFNLIAFFQYGIVRGAVRSLR